MACFDEGFPSAPIALLNALRISGEIRMVFVCWSSEPFRNCNDIGPERFIRGGREKIGTTGTGSDSCARRSAANLLRRFGGKVTTGRRCALSAAWFKFVPAIILTSHSENAPQLAVSRLRIIGIGGRLLVGRDSVAPIPFFPGDSTESRPTEKRTPSLR